MGGAGCGPVVDGEFSSCTTCAARKQVFGHGGLSTSRTERRYCLVVNWRKIDFVASREFWCNATQGKRQKAKGKSHVLYPE